MSDPPTTMVIRGLYDLRPGPNESGVTAADVARYLNLEEESVLAALRALKTKRVGRDRRRKGERVWEPWGGWR